MTDQQEQEREPKTVLERIGGIDAVGRLVGAFYPKVVKDPDLAPLFAESDIEEVMRKQRMFLTQFLGGPPLYSEEFGHPMLRYRHMPFQITPRRAEAWLRCMKAALDETLADEAAKQFLFHRLTQTAHHMVNTDESAD